MKKILFISGIQIFPPESGGQLRSAHLCLALAEQGHCVEVYSFTGRKKDYLDHKKSEEINISQNLSEFINRHPLFGFIQYLFYLLKLPPFWLTLLTNYFVPTSLQKKIISSDLIILDFPFLLPLIQSNKKTILNTHNAEFTLYKNYLISSLVKKIELKSFQKAHEIFFCSQDDLNKFLAIDFSIQSKSHLLPNGVDIRQFVPDKSKRIQVREQLSISLNTTVFIFTGSKFYPNIEAFQFLKKWSIENDEFLKENQIVILVVGSVCSEIFISESFKIIGRVDEIIPYLWAADFGLNPIILGSGTNVKMVEFVAAQLPVVTTSFGSRGLNLSDNDSCLFFERENLKKIMKNALSKNSIERKQMTVRAFEENVLIIDMKKALENIRIQW